MKTVLNTKSRKRKYTYFGFWLLSCLFFLVMFFALPAFGQVPEADDLAEAATNIGFDRQIIKLFLIVTVLSLAPGIAMMITCLPFLVIVFSFLRQAIGLQQSPPNMMIMGLAMFLTFFIMEPVFTKAWQEGISPYMDGEISETQATERTLEPFIVFMNKRVEKGAVERLAASMPDREYDVENPRFSLLVAAFMLSEIKRGFQIGFVIFLPFLIIDLIVASVLMAMGMMMVPPAVVSLPFKLAFFVVADGWLKITEALIAGYG